MNKDLTLEIAELFFLNPDSIDLSEFTTLSDAAAESLGKHNGSLQLSGLTSLSDAAAESLAKHNSGLTLNGLTSLSDAAAEALGKHEGNLSLNGLTSLSDAAAEALATPVFKTWLEDFVDEVSGEVVSLKRNEVTPKGGLYLNGLSSLSDTAIEALSKYKGGLKLNRLILLSDAAAEALARQEGYLFLNGLTSISDAAIEALVKHKDYLELDGLTRISDKASAIIGSATEISVNDVIKEQIRLIKLSKLREKKYLSSKEVFHLFSIILSDYEYISFKWYGGGDSFNGFQFEEAKKDDVEIKERPIELTDELIEKLDNSTIFEDMNLQINCVDQGWSEGVLLVAIQELTNDFYWDEVAPIEESEGFKGMSISGRNFEDLSNNIEL